MAEVRKKYGTSILPQAMVKLPEQALLAGISSVELNATILMSRQLVGQLPWGHNIAVMSKCKNVIEATFELTHSLPENLNGSLPSIEEIEKELSRNQRVGDE